jgi:hypothetical protein
LSATISDQQLEWLHVALSALPSGAKARSSGRPSAVGDIGIATSPTREPDMLGSGPEVSEAVGAAPVDVSGVLLGGQRRHGPQVVEQIAETSPPPLVLLVSLELEGMWFGLPSLGFPCGEEHYFRL